MTTEFIKKLNRKSLTIGVIGLGYVGLPLGLEFALKGFHVIGFDINEKKIICLKKTKTYINHISEKKISKAVSTGKFEPTTDFSKLKEVDAVIICVPTPLNRYREPDMSFIVETAKTIQKYLQKGQLVILQSTTYPGTTNSILLPLLEEAPIIQFNENISEKYECGKDFYLAYSPEREDPNNSEFNTATTPKVVGGVTKNCLMLACALFDTIIVKTIPVSSTQAAEAAKLLENIYRAINIALVNELKMVFTKMDIDIWEVIEAAKTKPFGFTPFYPGPGLGGHCIPIDPFYLTWKAREYEISTKFIELAGEINTYQPYFVVDRVQEVLNKHRKTLNGSKIIILGAAYKKDIDDLRESPTLKLIEIFRRNGAEVDYNDPYIPKISASRKYNFNMISVELSKENLKKYDILILSTDHSEYDYKFIVANSNLIIDTRNIFSKIGINSSKIWKA